MLEFVDPDDALDDFVALIYGDPGVGKTNFATAYPKEWGRAAYIAVDHDGWRLDSVLPQHRDKLTVVRFNGDNPIDNMNEIAIHPWKKEGFNVLIVDTFTHAARAMLAYAAKAGIFPAKDRIVFGPKSAEITQGLPIPGDYNGAQWLVENWLTVLFAHQRGMKIIIVCHEDLHVPRKDDPASVVTTGGPATIGRAIMTSFPSHFPVVIRLAVKSRTGLDGKRTSKYLAIGAMEGDYIARIKENRMGGNPMASVELQRDPTHWYADYVKNFMTKKETV